MHVICLSPCLSFFFLVLLCNTSCTSSQRAASIFFNLLDRIRGFWSVSCISPALVAVPSFPGSVTHWGVSTCIKVYSVQECFCSGARHCACLSLYMSGEPKFSFYFVVCPVPVTSHGVFFFFPRAWYESCSFPKLVVVQPVLRMCFLAWRVCLPVFLVFDYNEAYSMNSVFISFLCNNAFWTKTEIFAIGIFPFFCVRVFWLWLQILRCVFCFDLAHCSCERMHQNEWHVALWTV